MDPTVITVTESPSIKLVEYPTNTEPEESVRYLIQRVSKFPTQQTSQDLFHFSALFPHRELSGDVTLICSDRPRKSPISGNLSSDDENWEYSVFKAHKEVLTRSSGFFHRYFQSFAGNIEPNSTHIAFCILLPNISGPVLTSMLELFYTGQVYLQWEDLKDFWSAAAVLNIRYIEPGVEWLYDISTAKVQGGSYDPRYNIEKVYHSMAPAAMISDPEQAEDQTEGQPPVLVISQSGAMALPSSAVLYQIDSSQLEQMIPLPVQVAPETPADQVRLHYQEATVASKSEPKPSTSTGKTPPSSTTQQDPEKTFSCPLCPSVLRSKKSYSGHMYRHKVKAAKERDTNNNSNQKSEESEPTKCNASPSRKKPKKIETSQPTPQTSSSEESSDSDSD